MTTHIFNKNTVRWLAYTIALALAYALLARLSKLSLIPPFDVSLLWLPAGLSTAAALLLGARVIPGIWIGSAINNCLTLGAISSTTLLLSFGSAVQPVVIALLAGRLAQVGCYAPTAASGATRATGRDPIALAIGLCASFALGGVVAPTIGALALCASGLNSWHEFPHIWGTWWSGDMLGMLMLTPLLWHWASRRQQRDAMGSVLVPLGITIAGLGPFAFLMHESAESSRQLMADDSATQLLIQQNISYAVLGVFMALGFTILFITRQQSRSNLALVRAEQEHRKRDDILDSVLLASNSVLYTCRAWGDYGPTFVSNNIQAMTGYTSVEFLDTASFWIDHIHPEDAPGVMATLPLLFEQDHHSHEYRFRTKDGHYRWLHDVLKLERDAEGRPLEIAGVMTDITERKAAEAQLRESQKLEAIGQLTGGLAHDFNNLLGIVVGNLDQIGAHLPEGDARLRQQHQAALQAALRGAEVTRSLLAVARRQPLEVGCHELNALLTEMLPLAKSSAGSAVRLRSDLAAGELPAQIDPSGLSNVVLNLVINARDAMQEQPGELLLTLRTRRVLHEPGTADTLGAGWYAVLEVADNGPGMSEAVRTQAFEPFFTTKERGRGTGLGLAMVHGYATQLGGTARIQSEPGVGTTVQLYLPMDAASATAAAASEAQRLTALKAHALLDTAPEPEFDQLVAQAARLCGTPIALVSLVDAERQWFKASVGLQATQTPRTQAFCAHAIAAPGGMLVVPDAKKDARFSANALVLGEPHVGFYAGVVLYDAAGEALGTLCVIDHQPRQLNAAQLAQLQRLAEQVATLIRARAPGAASPSTSASLAAPRWGSAPAEPSKTTRVTTTPARRVLVVDDEPALCDLASDWLESLGFEPTAAHSPAQALQHLAAEHFDILFTDIVMPGGMDGLALARQAKAQQPHLRIVLTSGYAQSLLDTPDLPGTLINKPYRKNDLHKALAVHVDSTGDSA